MTDEKQTLVASRSGYRSKFTRIKNIIAKYDKDKSLLKLSSAISEIEHNLSLMPALRNNLESITDKIISLTDDMEDRRLEQESLDLYLDDFDVQETKLIALRDEAKKSPVSETDSIRGMVEMLSNKLDEQLVQQEVERRVAEAKYKMDREAEQKKFEATLNLLVSDNHSFTASSPKSKDPTSKLKLKELSIPEFSGEYSEWMGFRDLFLAIIDKNDALADVQKLYYLKSSLTGEAKSIIGNLPTAALNYRVAWDMLVDRYDDKMGIAVSHIKSFMDAPKIHDPSAASIRRAQVTLSSSIQALDAMGMGQRDIWLIYLALEKLDEETRMLWSRKTYKSVPTWTLFMDFLNERYKTMEIANPGKHSSAKTYEKTKPPKISSNLTSTSTPVPGSIFDACPGNQCASCGKTNHRTVKCYKFRGMNDTQRHELVKNAKLCVNCLDPGHSEDECQSSVCRNCGEKHSTWLHFHFHPKLGHATSSSHLTSTDTMPVIDSAPSPVDNPIPGTSTRTQLHCSTGTQPQSETPILPNVLLATAVVCVENAKGERILCRALLDSGSQANIITERICQLLKFPKKQSNCRLEGIGAQEAHSKYQVSVRFGPRDTDNLIQTDCFVQSKITGLHPSVQLSSKLPIPTDLVLADPQWNTPQTIDMLIGGRHYWDLVLDQTIRMGPGLPLLKHSVFGWMVVGEVSPNQAGTLRSYLTTLESIDTVLRRFWEIEEYTGAKQQREQDDDLAEKMYQETTTRLSNGQFMVHLPFNDQITELESNIGNAKKQLYLHQKAINTTPGMSEKFKEVFNEYEELGIIERVPDVEIPCKAYYMPYRGIFKEESSTTKLRIVYNASSKNKSQVSLNDTLLIGPVIQPPLVVNLWRFRRYPYAATGDITKMYLQFLVYPPHRDFLRFLRRNSNTGEIEHWRFRTLVFGVASSPFLAVRSVKQVIIEDGDKYPKAKEVAEKCFYVDDCLMSAQSPEELRTIKEQLIELMKCAGLKLCKWTSNVPDLSEEVTSKEVSGSSLNTSDGEMSKALGICWDHNKDHLSFKMLSEVSVHPTKREVLSVIARIFDPLGLLGPIIVNAKLILQELWKLQCDWDKKLPNELINQWNSFLESLKAIATIKVPRSVSEFTQVAKWQVHVFVDASVTAYGAAVYIVTEDYSQNRSVHLLTAKSRIAPVKFATIPKLELSAAELGSKIVNAVCESYQCADYHCWSDAKAVICQIRAPKNREVFVRNRVKVILENTSSDTWKYVRSNQNPADIISRGATAEQLLSAKEWWNGPKWLLAPSEDWPNEEPEIEKQLATLALTVNWTTPREYLFHKSNSFSYIRRVLAWVLRFVHNFAIKYGCRSDHPGTRRDGPLQAEEISQAEIRLAKLEQHELLPGDIHILKGNTKKKTVTKHLRPLGVFLDADGVMRAGGRLANADIQEVTKKPIVLPGGQLSKILLYYTHHSLGHAGPTLMLSTIREKYWPLFGKRSLQRVYHSCVICTMKRIRPCQQEMGQLPTERVNFTRPFESTGVDFAGPITIKVNRLRKALMMKAYIAVYVCMATKAVHLEVVSDLSTESFLASLRRFTARRGTPTKMFSDNATNFVGAANQINHLQNPINVTRVIDATSGQGIQWKFIPPRSPHWGGLWEAAVKAFKYHFVRVIGPTILTIEELMTVVCQIEGVLNSRPLTVLPSTPDEPKVLTPAQFLLSAPTTNFIDWNYLEGNRLDRWQTTQKIFQDLAKRWKKEYLLTLHRRAKWTEGTINLKAGDVVALLEDTSDKTSWPIGVIHSVHPGKDGKVRMVSVKTSKGIYHRTIQNLMKLPINVPEEDQPLVAN